MKLHSLIILALFQILFSFSAIGQVQKYTTANLNLRAHSNTNSPILTTIPVGTGIEISEDCECPWIKIYYRGQTGYINTTYLSNNRPIAQQRTQSTRAPTKSHVKYYINSAGERVQSPTHYSSPPTGATALCRDGTYSFSRNRRGTCSGHGGVARWL